MTGPVTKAIAAINNQAPSRRQFFGSAAGAGIAAAQPPIFLAAGASSLALLCDATVASLAAMDDRGVVEHWTEDQWDEAFEQTDAGFERAISEPSQGLQDIAAKARLAIDDFRRFKPSPEHFSGGEALALAVLKEIVALAG